MENINGWVIHKNAYTGTYNAVKREDFNLLFNDVNNPKVLKSKSFNTLEEIINKTDGDEEKIKNLL